MRPAHTALIALLLVGCPPVDTPNGDDTATEGSWLRIVSWNTEELGNPGEPAYDAAVRILRRLDGDIVALQEIADNQEIAVLEGLASELGYPHVLVPNTNPFGDARNAILSRLQPTDVDWPSAAELSGDTRANDITRFPIVATYTIPSIGPLTVVTQHWKSGFSDADLFRRAVESRRVVQAGGRANPTFAWVVVAGDLNASIHDPPDEPERFTSVPSGLPGGFVVGQDVRDIVGGSGLANDAFEPLIQGGYRRVDMTQRNGEIATRPQSGRQIDYLFTSPPIPFGVRAEIYNCDDEELPGLPMAGEPIPDSSCRLASDHLPIVVDLPIP